jgi:ethanolamine utilization protein
LHLVGGRAGVSPALAARLEETFAIHEHTAWEDHVPPEASVLLSRLGIQALARVAWGDEGCTVEGRALLEAILLGRPAVVLKSGLVWRAYGAPKALAARYAEYEKNLESYGLKIVDEDGVIPALLGRETQAGTGGPPRDAAPCAAQKRGGRRVINEAAIKAACPEARGLGQTLAISPGDILTPLAKDYVLSMRINITGVTSQQEAL